MNEDQTPTLVRDWLWSRTRADQWAQPGSTARRGLCGWNHKESDRVQARRLVIIEEPYGVQDVWACCDDCYEAVRKYARPAEA